MQHTKTLISIVGPTAVGKTALSIALANHFQTVIISGDSRQFYRYMDIGTAKATKEEQLAAPHYFLDFLNPDENYSAGQFEREVEQLLTQLFQKHEVVIIVGGSTLYFNALWHGIDEIPDTPVEVRNQLNQAFQENGLTPLLAELEEVDAETYHKIDKANHARIIRALEVYRATGLPISHYRKKTPKQTFYRHLKIGLNTERAALYHRIDERVLKMLEMGLIEEVKTLLEMGYSPSLSSMQAIGYKEVIDYLNQEIEYAKMVELIQQFSRNYAKRQLTWFRRETDIHWFDPLVEKKFLLEKVVSLYENISLP